MLLGHERMVSMLVVDRGAGEQDREGVGLTCPKYRFVTYICKEGQLSVREAAKKVIGSGIFSLKIAGKEF